MLAVLLILGTVAVVTLLITRSVEAATAMLAPLLIAAGINAGR